jgi:hypothetical protein
MRALTVYGIHLGLGVLAVGLCCQKGWWRRHRWACWASCAAICLAGALFIPLVSDPQEWFSDFNKGYYPAGRLILQEPSALYSIPELGFVNLPALALLFTPVAFLPLPLAQKCFTVPGLVALALACWLLLRLTGATGWRRAAVVSAFALNGPLYYSIREGNLTHFVLLLLAGAAWCLEKRRDVWLGVFLAVAAFVKLPLFLLVACYGLRGRGRVAAGAGLATLVLVGTSLALFGVGVHQEWLQRCILPFLGKPLAAYNVQSAGGFLARLLTDRSIGDWQPFAVGWDFKAGHYALVGLLVGATGWVSWRSRTARDPQAEHTEFSALLCLALVISPISWTHYYLLLLVPFALYFGNRLRIPVGGPWAALLLAALLLISPPVIALPSPKPFVWLFLSHCFAGGVLLLAVLLAGRRRGLRATEEARFRPALLRGADSWQEERGALVPGGAPRASRLLGTSLCYLLVSLVVTGVWGFCARTEYRAELDCVCPAGQLFSSRFCSVVHLADGRAVAPFVRRRLLPDLARGLAAVVPGRTWAGLRRWLEGNGTGAASARAYLRRLGWQLDRYPLLFCAFALIYGSVVGFLFTCRWLVLLLYDCPRWAADVAGAALGLALLGCIGDWHYCLYPYDFPNAFVFTLALAALLGRRWWFVPAFAAAAYSKETAILLILAYVLLAEERHSPRFWGLLGVLLAVYLAVWGWLRFRYPAPEVTFWFPGRNAKYLATRVFYLWFAPLLAVGLARLLSAWRLYPPALRKLCWLAVPLLGVAFFKGWIEELRQYLELLPIIGLIVLQWLLHEAGAAGLLRPRSSPAGPSPAPA